MQTVIQTIVSTFARRGDEKYADEGVTQLQHALQCADLAQDADAPATLIAAALLHDIGHIIGSDDLPPDCSVDLDDRHESVGFDFLNQHFGPEVAEPVRLHVAAKRFLCTTEPSYRQALSPTSLKSYFDQGGPMDEQELAQFRDHPFFVTAVQLRRWDDLAKFPEKHDLAITEFLPQLQQLLSSRTVTPSCGKKPN